MVLKTKAAGRATRAAAKVPRGSRDASEPSRRERSGGTVAVASGTKPVNRGRLQDNTGPGPRTQGRSGEKHPGKARTSRDAAVGVVAVKKARRVGYICPPCGRFVATEVDGWVFRVTRGSPPRFCSPSCRQAAYRRRQAGVAEDVPLQLSGGRGRSLGPAPAKDRRRVNA